MARWSVAPLLWETNWYPLHGKPVGSQSTFWLFGNYVNVFPLPVKMVVQAGALALPKMHHRDALKHPVATVLFVYHEPHVTIQINAWPVTVATELYIRQIFSEQLGTLRNTNLQRTPGQTVLISAQSICKLRCHKM